MKLDFNFQFKKLNGEISEGADSHVGKTIASYLAFVTKEVNVAPTKLWGWATKLFDCKSIEVDDTDKDVLIALIEKAEQLPVAVRAQVISSIKEQVEAQKS